MTLEPMVVTATVTPTPLSQSTASVTVISQEQIAAQHATSVIDVLRQVPGLHVDQAGARGGISSVYTRGSDPNFTVVLIDGVKVNDPTNSRGGSFDFTTLSTDAIERIEIVRGPLSAVYGSDALGGVINIITQRGDGEPTGRVEVSGGRFGAARVLGQAHGKVGVLDYAASGSYLDNGTPVPGSGFTSRQFHVNAGVSVTDTMALRWVLRYADSRSQAFPDDSGGPQFAVRREPEHRDATEITTGLTLTHQPLPWWDYSLQMGLYSRQEDIMSPGVAPGVRDPFGLPPSVTDTTFYRTDVALRQRVTVARGVHVAFGVQGQFEDGTSTGSLLLGTIAVPTTFSLTRSTWGPFVEAQLSLVPGLLLQGGVRVDLQQHFDAEVSPRAGVTYTLAATQTTVRVNWGEGFKLPSFFALSHPLVGNPALVPETSQSIDVGVSQAWWGQRGTVGVTYFASVYTNLIDFEAGPPPRLVNRAETTIQGVELFVRLRPWAVLGTTAHLTYLQTDIKGTTAVLRNRPQWRGGVAVHWVPRPDLDVHVQTVVVGRVPDSSIPTGPRTLDAYARVDGAVTWTPTQHWQVFLAVDNLFNAAYEEFVGFRAPGITPRGGVRASF